MHGSRDAKLGLTHHRRDLLRRYRHAKALLSLSEGGSNLRVGHPFVAGLNEQLIAAKL
jgi:hypothetical protein